MVQVLLGRLQAFFDYFREFASRVFLHGFQICDHLAMRGDLLADIGHVKIAALISVEQFLRHLEMDFSGPFADLLHRRMLAFLPTKTGDSFFRLIAGSGCGAIRFPGRPFLGRDAGSLVVAFEVSLFAGDTLSFFIRELLQFLQIGGVVIDHHLSKLFDFRRHRFLRGQFAQFNLGLVAIDEPLGQCIGQMGILMGILVPDPRSSLILAVSFLIALPLILVALSLLVGLLLAGPGLDGSSRGIGFLRGQGDGQQH